MNSQFKKILVIGAGPVVIGQSSEFDYAGVQMCRALKDEGIETVVVNSNPITVSTDRTTADKVYIEPLNSETVKKIIEIEKPDGVLATVGGKTGLDICLELAQNGELDEQNTKLLGVQPEVLKKLRNAQALRDTLEEIGEPFLKADIVDDSESALGFSTDAGYPVSIKPAFTPDCELIRCDSSEDILSKFSECAEKSLVSQVYIQKCVDDYKEIEFEVIRDGAGNCISVASCESIDPVGISSGDSIVTVPAQTMTDTEQKKLRRAARKIVKFLKIEGSCLVRFALKSDGSEYAVISVEPQMNRTTALISKVTGYPVAAFSAKIALGKRLYEIKNDITGKLTAANEPAIDYCGVKVPKWSFENFGDTATRHLGETMQATGEALAVGTSFELSFMKAIRSVNPKTESAALPKLKMKTDEEIRNSLSVSDDERIFTVYEAIKRGFSLAEIKNATHIDMYFLSKLKNIADTENELSKGLNEDLYYKAKSLGFLDSTIKRITGEEELRFECTGNYNTVDTCAAEYDVEKPYYYSSHDEDNEAQIYQKSHPSSKKKILVVGSGPYSIGLGADRDYAAVECLKTLKNFGFDTVMLNNNPSAVSTDFAVADSLYLDPITDEDVLNAAKCEKPYGAVLPFGGGNAVRKSELLRSLGVRIFGADIEIHNKLKNKIEFFDMLDALNIKHTSSRRVMLGTGLEADVLTDGKDFLIPGICERIEKAQINPGDCVAVYPAISVNEKIKETLVEYTEKIIKELKYSGLVNIQFAVYDNELYVTSASVVATRNVPFMSKAASLPIIEFATRLMLGETLGDIGVGTGLYREASKHYVRVPVFSFESLEGTDVQLGSQMKSTGEVMGIADTFDEALLKALIASGMRIKRTGGVLITVADTDKPDSIKLANEFLKQGFKIYATSNTAKLLNSNHVAANAVRKIHEGRPNTMSLITENRLSYLVSTDEHGSGQNPDGVKIRRTALMRRIPVLPSVETAAAFAKCLSENSVLDEIKVSKL